MQAYSNIDGVEGGELRKRCREQEFEISKYQECIKELEATSEEDRQRIDQLLNECKTLSGQVNEENEEKEKYKTGYVNMKRRIDKMETKMKEVKCLTSAAVSECFQCSVGEDSRASRCGGWEGLAAADEGRHHGEQRLSHHRAELAA